MGVFTVDLYVGTMISRTDFVLHFALLHYPLEKVLHFALILISLFQGIHAYLELTIASFRLFFFFQDKRNNQETQVKNEAVLLREQDS